MLRKYWFPILLIIASFAATALAYPSLPREIPIHWNFEGQPDDYASKQIGAWMLPGMMLLMFSLFVFLPKLDPRRHNYKKFVGSYHIITQSIIVFFAIVNGITLAVSLGYDIPINKFVPLFVGILLIVLGNYMQKVKPNYFVGIRTPWTLENEEVWYLTHRFGSKVFVIMGLLFMCMIFVSSELVAFVLIAVILLASLSTIFMSYYYSKKVKEK